MNKTNLMIFYENCPSKYKFIRSIISRTGVSLNTVLNWCKGYVKPNDDNKLTALSEETGIPKDKLFEIKK